MLVEELDGTKLECANEPARRAVECAISPDMPDDTRFDLAHLADPCTSAELAAVLNESAKTIVDWCQERAYTRIPCFRLGNRWYHRLPELMRWLNGIKGGQIEFRRKPRISRKRR